MGVSLVGFLTQLSIPILWVTRKLSDRADRAAVLRIYRELQRTGDVVKALPAEQRAVREAVEQAEGGEAEGGRRKADGKSEVRGQKSEVTGREAEGGRRKAEGTTVAAPPPRSPMLRAVPELPPELISRPEPAAGPEPAAPAPAPPPVEQRRPEPRPEPVRPERPPEPPATVPLTPRPLRTSDFALPTSQAPFRLHPGDPVVDSPGIGSKTAGRMNEAGVRTVADLLAADPHELADALETRWIVPETVRDWQDQAELMCRVPGLHGHDAQILVAVGVTEPADLVGLTAEDLLSLTEPLINSADGRRILRGSVPPDLDEVRNWIAWGEQSRPLPTARRAAA